MKISDFLQLLLLGLLLAACSTIAPEKATADRVALHLSRTFEAHAAATDLWDRLLLGETVSCQETFDAPPFLALSATEISQAPESATVQTPLNSAISVLQDLLALWEAECQQNQPFVPQARVRIAQGYLQEAHLALRQAAQAWYVWQP